MRVKLKLTDIRSGQESLLLVTNLNAKGLLVQAAKTLPIGNRVKLNLQLEDGQPSLDLLGEIHKIALRKGGGKGMIIRFLDPPNSAIGRIANFLTEKLESSPAETQETPDQAPSANRTMIVDLEDPANIPLRPPLPKKKKKKEKPLSSTVDEEDMNDVDDLLGGDTRMLALNEFESFSKKRKRPPWIRWFLIGGFSLVMIPLLLFLGERLQLFRARVVTDDENAIVAPESTRMPSENLQSKDPTPSTEPARSLAQGASGITEVDIEMSPKRVEITLTGTQPFADPQIEKKMSPRRLILRFPTLDGFTINKVVPVSKNPLLRIRTSKTEEGVQMIMDLYPVAFPRFETKKQGTTLTIYLYR